MYINVMRLIAVVAVVFIAAQCSFAAIPTATNPKYVSVYDSGSVQPKKWPIDSVVRDTVPHSDSSIYSEYSDSSAKAGVAYGFMHGVDTYHVPFSKDSTSFGTTDLMYNTAIKDLHFPAKNPFITMYDTSLSLTGSEYSYIKGPFLRFYSYSPYGSNWGHQIGTERMRTGYNSPTSFYLRSNFIGEWGDGWDYADYLAFNDSSKQLTLNYNTVHPYSPFSWKPVWIKNGGLKVTGEVTISSTPAGTSDSILVKKGDTVAVCPLINIDGMVHIKTFSGLQAAIALYGTTIPCNLSIDSSFSVTSNTVLTPNFNIARWLNGSIISGTNRYLTVNKMTIDPLFQIADTSGIYLVFGKGARTHIRYEWWGAKADSSTNCTKAMNCAHAAVYNSGFGTVLLSDGVYKNRGGFDLGGIHNFTLQGSGNSWMYMMDSSNVSMFYSGYGVGHITGIKNFKCRNVKFNGNYTKQVRTTSGVPWFISTQCAIVLNYVDNGVVEYCEFWYCPGGVDVINAGYYERSIINNNLFRYCGIGLDTYGYGAQINFNTFEDIISMPEHAKVGAGIICEPVMGDYYVKAHQSNDTMYIDSLKQLIKLSFYFQGKTLTWDPYGIPVTSSIVSIISDTSAIVNDSVTRSIQELKIRGTIDQTLPWDSTWYYGQYFNVDNEIIGNTMRNIEGTPIFVNAGSVRTNVSKNEIANFGGNGISASQAGAWELNISNNIISNSYHDRDSAYVLNFGHGIQIADPNNVVLNANNISYCNNGVYVRGLGSSGLKSRIVVSSNIFSFNSHFGAYLYNCDGGLIHGNLSYNNNRSYDRTGVVSGIGCDGTSRNLSVYENLCFETDSGQYYSVYLASGTGFQDFTVGENPGYGVLKGNINGEFGGGKSDIRPSNYINKKVRSVGTTGTNAVAGFTVIPDSNNLDAALATFLPFDRAAGELYGYNREYRNGSPGQLGLSIMGGGQILSNGNSISSRGYSPSCICTTLVGSDTLKCRNATYLLPGDRIVMKNYMDSLGTFVDYEATVTYVSPTYKTVVLNRASDIAGTDVRGYFRAYIGDLIFRNSANGGILYCRTSSTTTNDAVWDAIYPVRGAPTTGQVIRYNSGTYAEWGDADTASKLKMTGNNRIPYVNNGILDTSSIKYNPSGKYVDFPSMISLSDSNSYSVPGFIYRHVKTADSGTATTAWGIGFGNPGTGLSASYGAWMHGQTNADGGSLTISSGDSGVIRQYSGKYISWNLLGSQDSAELRVSCGHSAGINSYAIKLSSPDTATDFDLFAAGRTAASISMRRYATYIDTLVSSLFTATKAVFNGIKIGSGSDTTYIDSSGITSFRVVSDSISIGGGAFVSKLFRSSDSLFCIQDGDTFFIGKKQ